MDVRPKYCKWCKTVKPTHFQFQCYSNPKRSQYKIPLVGKRQKQWQRTRNSWFDSNPPDQWGMYQCALMISDSCVGQMLPSETTLDHIMPRSRRPDLVNDHSNLQPSCYPCNSEKGSRVLSAKEAL